MTRSDRQRLHDMLEAIDDIRLCTAAGRDSFDTDRITQHAVMHCLTIIGECASRITSATASKIPSLTVAEAKGLRNIIVHEYWRVSLSDIWTTINHDLPRLAYDIRSVLDDLERSLDTSG